MTKNTRRNKTNFKPKGLNKGKALISRVWSASANKDNDVFCVGYKGEKDWNNPNNRKIAARPDLLLKRDKMCMQSHTVPKQQARFADFMKNPPVLQSKGSFVFSNRCRACPKCGGKSKNNAVAICLQKCRKAL